MALVRSKVGHGQKEAPREARPNGVAVGGVQGPVEDLRSVVDGHEVPRFGQAYARRQGIQQEVGRGEEAAEDDGHLGRLCDPDRLVAAKHRVEHHDRAGEQNGGVQIPTQHGRKNDARRIQGDARRQTSRQEKEGRGQQAHTRSKYPLQIAIGRRDTRRHVAWNNPHADHQQSDGHAKVELRKAQAVRKALPGGRNKRNGRRLGRNNAQANGRPMAFIFAG